MKPSELAKQLLDGTVKNVLSDRGIFHFVSGGVYIKELRMWAGDIGVQHKHLYDHFSITTGRVIVATDTGDQAYPAGTCILLAAGINHSVRALEDLSWFCIHAVPPGLSDTEVLAGEMDNVVIQRGP